MLHRQTTVQPLIPSAQTSAPPAVNPPPAQPSVPAPQPQPMVGIAFLMLLNKHKYVTIEEGLAQGVLNLQAVDFVISFCDTLARNAYEWSSSDDATS